MADYTIDCKGKSLGRVASDVALILQGKKDPSYDPRLAGNDRAIITNVDSLKITGKKKDSKIYYSHTTQIGHLKKESFGKVVEKHGKEEVLRRAVSSMLPKNKLRKERMKQLIFESK